MTDHEVLTQLLDWQLRMMNMILRLMKRQKDTLDIVKMLGQHVDELEEISQCFCEDNRGAGI